MTCREETSPAIHAFSSESKLNLGFCCAEEARLRQLVTLHTAACGSRVSGAVPVIGPGCREHFRKKSQSCQSLHNAQKLLFLPWISLFAIRLSKTHNDSNIRHPQSSYERSCRRGGLPSSRADSNHAGRENNSQFASPPSKNFW